MKITEIERMKRPIKVLQFGGGVFLRGFFDWMLAKANACGAYCGNAVIVRAKTRGQDPLAGQNFMYTHVARDGEHSDVTLVDCIEGSIDPTNDYEGFLALAAEPSLEIVVSNTTEAGIVYVPCDRPEGTVPESFPARLVQVLYHRFSARLSGLLILPCELIEDNGDTLRDVTATVDSIPLIASSIMSKKLAAGTRSIVLDVKCGSGAFMDTPERARELAETMVSIGKSRGRSVAALITNMDIPLGHAIGNALEVKEAIDVLRGSGPADLGEVCLALASVMLELSLSIDEDSARALARKTLDSGAAYAKFIEWIGEQGGDASYAAEPDKFGTSPIVYEVKAKECGYVTACNAEAIGIAAMKLGAGRASKDDVIDHLSGIILCKKPGDRVECGDVLAVLHTAKADAVAEAEGDVLCALRISDSAPELGKMIYCTVR